MHPLRCFWPPPRGEETGAFQRDINAIGGMGQVRGIALRRHLDALAIDDDVVAIGLHRARKRAMDAVALEQHCIGFGIGQIVDRHQFQTAIGRSRMARATLRPIRPKPLIATFVVMLITPFKI